jgi:hypothetical protein
MLYQVFEAMAKITDVCLGVKTCCLLQLYLRNYTGSTRIPRCHVRIDNNFINNLFPIKIIKMNLLKIRLSCRVSRNKLSKILAL